MRNLRVGLIVFALIMIIGQLYVTDYNDLSWSNNTGSYLGIFSMICVVIAMLSSNNHDKKKSQ